MTAEQPLWPEARTDIHRLREQPARVERRPTEDVAEVERWTLGFGLAAAAGISDGLKR